MNIARRNTANSWKTSVPDPVRAQMEAKTKSTGTSASDRRNFTGDPADPDTFWAFLRQFFPEKAAGLSSAAGKRGKGCGRLESNTSR